MPVRQPGELAQWLRRKASASGFAVENLQVIPQGDLSFSKPGTRGTHAAVDFRGTLEVTDPAGFHRAFTAGIGSAKAFGFGLLVIAPLSGA
ncbi:MAG: type I-E CRISPR-associated protein Cas6/Cse3/CasE [Chloroflexi bacterium]|nr:type I-E CRISPR-associated protein Cas6/Cse3/CasE [Chloroflexota bacterium]